jgi:glycosyltransferase involved in cell wall biosynthesis
MPLISIGITCFNAELTIKNAIESALNQTWINKEIVIVDDCSIDNSCSIIRTFVEKFDFIYFYQNKKNIGVAGTRNNIIKYANGEYIVFFDDDDISDINRLDLQYQRIINYKNKWLVCDPIICHSSRQVIFSDGKSAIEETIGCNLNNISPNGEQVASRILLGTPLNDGYGSIATCSQMGLKADYIYIGGFDESFRRQEDTEFNIRFALCSGHFVGIKEPLVNQFLTKSDDKSIDIEERSTLNVLKKYRNFIGSRSNYNFVVFWIKMKFLFYKKDYFLFLINFIILLIKHPIYFMKRLFFSLPNIIKNYRYFNDSR